MKAKRNDIKDRLDKAQEKILEGASDHEMGVRPDVLADLRAKVEQKFKDNAGVWPQHEQRVLEAAYCIGGIAAHLATLRSAKDINAQELYDAAMCVKKHCVAGIPHAFYIYCPD